MPHRRRRLVYDLTPAVLWMRHGTSDDGLCRPRAHARPGSPLTIGGAIEVERIARSLVRHRWQPSAIASSPLRRTRQTATIAASLLDVPTVLSDPSLQEWRAPHCVVGLAPEQYPPKYLAWREHRARHTDTALPGGESLQVFAERAVDAATLATGLAAEYGNVLMVSHRLLIGAVAAIYEGHQAPADLFQHASGFRLLPAQVWAPRMDMT